LYASLDNWENLTLPELASLFPTPQRYFVPQKLRAAYHPRLQKVGLWPQTTDPAEEEKKKTPFEKEMRQKAPKLDKKRVQQMFSKEKVSI
jgi:sorting and assembly machinery component 37